MLLAFRFRTEIDLPRDRRVHENYAPPVVMDEALVARLDVKSDQAAVRRIASRITLEPDAPPDTLVRLRAEPVRVAAWLGFASVALSLPPPHRRVRGP